MKAFLLKVDGAHYTRWQEQAKTSGLKMSEWIRRRCNEACMGQFTVVEHEPLTYTSPKVKAAGELMAMGEVFTSEQIPVINPKKLVLDSPRKPCKHGIRFCKKCS